jgi:hypothetical protein
MDYCAAQFQIKFSRSFLHSFVLRHSGDGIQTKSAAQEEQRLQVPRAFLKRTIQDRYDCIPGCVGELVVNLDEIGISDWENRKTEKVIMPAAMFAEKIYHGNLEM